MNTGGMDAHVEHEMNKNNLLENMPADLKEEIVETLIKHEHIRIERIVSRGQSSSENFWYEQEQNEWVMVIKGSAGLKFRDGKVIELHEGDYLNIPAYVKHRVEWTAVNMETVWLAVFY